MSDLIVWLLIVEVMGLLAFPLAFLLFSRLPDRGYTLTKPLALLLAAYLLWLLGLTQAVLNSPVTIAGILLLGAVAFGWLYYRRWPELEGFLKAQWRYVLLAEGLFLGLFLAWCLLLSEFPAINHTEKPMDFAFLNGILESRVFPPQDPWLAGHSISYYYFGHLIMSLPLQLGQIPSAVGYNLAVASLPALVGLAAFGLTHNLVRLSGGGSRPALIFGLIAVLLIILVGNLEGGIEFLHLRGWAGDGFWQWLGIKGLAGDGSGGGLFPDGNWWWWRATRVIDTLADGQSLDYTITEFPFFSFILGDLHSHVLSLPFLLLVLSLGLNLLLHPEPVGAGWLARHPWQAGATALCLGALAFINSWDFPLYAAIFGALLLIKAYAGQTAGPDVRETREELSIADGRRFLGRALLNAALLLIPLLLAALLLFLPFYLTLASQVSGVLPHFGPGTRPFLFFLVMGLPLLLGLGFLLRQLGVLSRPAPVDAPLIALVAATALTPLLLWTCLALAWGAVSPEAEPGLGRVALRWLLTLPGAAVAGLAAYCALQWAARRQEAVPAFPLLLLAAAAYLLMGAELFHLADFFGNRMNTVFKVYYQAWLLLGLAGAYGLYYCYRHRHSLPKWGRVGQYGGAVAAGLLLLVALYYPVGAALERTGLLRENHTVLDNSLDGLAYLRQSRPGEYAAIRWLREKGGPGPIVEAVGPGYSAHNAVSAATGRPTVLGWPGHEHQWRGSTDPFQGREEAVAQIYESGNPKTVDRLLTEYNIRYVYLGSRERAKYGVSDLSNLGGLLKTVFRQDGVIIYERAAGYWPDD